MSAAAAFILFLSIVLSAGAEEADTSAPAGGPAAPSFTGTFEALTDNGAAVPVYFNGKAVGETPYRSGKIPVGLYEVSILPPPEAASAETEKALRRLAGADTTDEYPRLKRELQRIARRQIVIKNGQHAQVVFGVGEMTGIVKAQKAVRTRVYFFGIVAIVAVLSTIGFLVL